MKTLILRLLLLVSGIFCLGCTSPAHGQSGDEDKIKILREALENASDKSETVTLKADFTDALNLVQLAINPEVPKHDEDNNLIFDYEGKSFVLKDDGADKETSHILYGKIKVVLFDPAAKDKKK